jgi:hypothetical protein
VSRRPRGRTQPAAPSPPRGQAPPACGRVPPAAPRRTRGHAPQLAGEDRRLRGCSARASRRPRGRTAPAAPSPPRGQAPRACGRVPPATQGCSARARRRPRGLRRLRARRGRAPPAVGSASSMASEYRRWEDSGGNRGPPKLVRRGAMQAAVPETQLDYVSGSASAGRSRPKCARQAWPRALTSLPNKQACTIEVWLDLSAAYQLQP